MSVDRLPSGMFRARVMIDGRRHTETFSTREEAEDWVSSPSAELGPQCFAPSRRRPDYGTDVVRGSPPSILPVPSPLETGERGR